MYPKKMNLIILLPHFAMLSGGLLQYLPSHANLGFFHLVFSGYCLRLIQLFYLVPAYITFSIVRSPFCSTFCGKGHLNFIKFPVVLISANAELKKHFSKCRDGRIRVLKVSIEEGTLLFMKRVHVKSVTCGDLFVLKLITFMWCWIWSGHKYKDKNCLQE